MPRKSDPDKKAKAVRLVLNYGASYRSVAEHVGMPVGSVSKAVHDHRRAKGTLPGRTGPRQPRGLAAK